MVVLIAIWPILALADDPEAIVVITEGLYAYDLYNLYAEDFDENGWAHITEDGHDIWVTVTGGDLGDIPDEESGESYCTCRDGA
ncbi:hypothetical protein JW859_11200 [bacterium]|nr:hypothetical protein [bacterium]